MKHNDDISKITNRGRKLFDFSLKKKRKNTFQTENQEMNVDVTLLLRYTKNQNLHADSSLVAISRSSTGRQIVKTNYLFMCRVHVVRVLCEKYGRLMAAVCVLCVYESEG